MRDDWVQDEVYGGCECDQNFHQLFVSYFKPKITQMLDKKIKQKYTDQHVQMTNSYISNIADKYDAGYFYAHSYVITGSASKEQVIVCPKF